MDARNLSLCFALMLAGAMTVALGLGCSNAGVGVPNVPPPGAATPAAATPAASPSPGTFSEINLNIIQPRCISCHSTENSAGGVNLSTYAGVVAQVVPNNPSQSPFYTQVESGAMPRGSAKLPDAQIQDIYNWIQAGAPND